MSLIKDVTTTEFETEVIKSDIPVFIDFHAKWCGPCKAVAPALADMAREFEGEIRIVKIDIDEEPELRDRYGVQGVPTFIILRDGEVKERFSGNVTRGKLSSVIQKHVGEA
ncbi:MAG: thioredoxin [Brevundimonas sp.]